MRATIVALVLAACLTACGASAGLPSGAAAGRFPSAPRAGRDGARPQAAGAPASARERARTEVLSPADLTASIDGLSAVAYPVRMDAARRIRRAPAAQAVPALIEAVGRHKDGYVRFRALVLLTGFEDPRTRAQVLAILTDRNDRLREVGYEYIEHNPDQALVPALLRALGQESAEFVRPALLRALAAQGRDPRVRAALLPEIARGETMFRSALIEALGDYRADYAVDPLIETAHLEGPLQVDAAIALGKIGDKRALDALVAAQRAAPQDAQPQIAAAICLLDVNCPSHAGYIDHTLRFAATNAGFQPLLRSAADAAGALGQAGRADAVNLLFDVGGASQDPVRAPIALALGAIALRATPLALSVLEKRSDRDAAILLLRDAFDMLEEPYEKERFFVAVRHAYWQAAEGSEARRIAQLLIEKLEF